MQPIRVARTAIHPVDMTGAIDRIDAFIRDGSPHYNIAINAAKVVACEDDAELRAAVAGAHLVTADGQAVVWASRLLGDRLPGRVAGADLMERLIAHAAVRGYSVYFLGARPEVVAVCVARARMAHPSLRIAGARDGYFTDEDSVIAELRAARPDIVFLGFGTPAKEYFMHRRYRDVGAPFVMGVGGSFDVYAGLVRRAPRWVQRAGLEWAFRLAQEPRRMWKRYLVGNSRFITIVARELARKVIG
jgi:N-acetylglucosaminyldiphosphoundecaprenol N-acetyl-beta-D-mannosaminyltransferase